MKSKALDVSQLVGEGELTCANCEDDDSKKGTFGLSLQRMLLHSF